MTELKNKPVQLPMRRKDHDNQWPCVLLMDYTTCVTRDQKDFSCWFSVQCFFVSRRVLLTSRTRISGQIGDWFHIEAKWEQNNILMNVLGVFTPSICINAASTLTLQISMGCNPFWRHLLGALSNVKALNRSDNSQERHRHVADAHC